MGKCLWNFLCWNVNFEKGEMEKTGTPKLPLSIVIQHYHFNTPLGTCESGIRCHLALSVWIWQRGMVKPGGVRSTAHTDWWVSLELAPGFEKPLPFLLFLLSSRVLGLRCVLSVPKETSLCDQLRPTLLHHSCLLEQLVHWSWTACPTEGLPESHSRSRCWRWCSCWCLLPPKDPLLRTGNCLITKQEEFNVRGWKWFSGSGGMAQWLDALAALPEVPASVPRPTWQLTV